MDLRLYIVVLLIGLSQKERRKTGFFVFFKAILALGLCIQEASRNTHSTSLNLARTAHSLAKNESESARKEYCVLWGCFFHLIGQRCTKSLAERICCLLGYHSHDGTSLGTNAQESRCAIQHLGYQTEWANQIQVSGLSALFNVFIIKWYSVRTIDSLLGHGLGSGGQGFLKTAYSMSLTLKDSPSSNEFTQWHWGGGEGTK